MRAGAMSGSAFLMTTSFPKPVMAQTATLDPSMLTAGARLTGDVPPSNITRLGLYHQPVEAYRSWLADPENVHFLDVRTFDEYIFVGHIPIAQNVPFVFPVYTRPEPGAVSGSTSAIPPGCSGEPNEEFVATVAAYFAPGDHIIAYCATGARAAMAIDALADSGFSNVYNLVTGLEGSRVDDPDSVHHGKHMRNGWKNSGLPWTYSFDPDLIETGQRP